MNRTPTNPYLRTKVLTASPAELRMMLLDGAVRFADQAHDGILKKDYERMFEGVSRAQAILVELMNGLEPKHDPELCKRLSGLYTYLYTRLVAASSMRDPAITEEVIKLLRYERETWQLLMDKLSGEQGGAAPADLGGATSAADGNAPRPATPQPRPRLSVEG